MYKKIIDIDEQLLCFAVQMEAQDSFDNLKKLFEIFQAKVWGVVFKSRHRKKDRSSGFMLQSEKIVSNILS